MASKADLNPATLEMPTCKVVGKAVTNGSYARCFAEYLRIDALMATGAKTFSQMPRFAAANGAGTENEAEALKKEARPLLQPPRIRQDCNRSSLKAGCRSQRWPAS